MDALELFATAFFESAQWRRRARPPSFERRGTNRLSKRHAIRVKGQALMSRDTVKFERKRLESEGTAGET